ncbi:unnamed protein product [Closterium sp. NIES-65]|nr:unnamed protein product [Closterium sp. NIES-65]
MEFLLRFRVPSVLLKVSHSDANIGTSIDTSSSAATSLAAERGEGGSAATIQQPAASHVDYPITVDPHEPLQSAFDKLLLSHLPHCCLPGQQTRQQHDDAESGEIQEGGKGSSSDGEEKQAVRFMAIEQVVYLTPTLSAVKARLKSATAPPSAPATAAALSALPMPAENSTNVANNSSTAGSGTSSSYKPRSTTGGSHKAGSNKAGSSKAGNSKAGSSRSSSNPFHTEHALLTRAHMVHYVDVHLPWSHSLCACCLPRMLCPAPPIAFQISSLTSLRKHLQQPYVPTMPPYRFGNKPPRFITAYPATIPLSAPPLSPPGSVTGASAAAEESAAAPSVAQQYRWKVDSAPVVAAEGMMLEWLAEPRVGLLLDLQNLRRQLAALLHMHEIADTRVATEARGTATAKGNSTAASTRLWWCCWQCSRCWTSYRHAVSIAAFTVLVAKFPHFVTL